MMRPTSLAALGWSLACALAACGIATTDGDGGRDAAPWPDVGVGAEPSTADAGLPEDAGIDAYLELDAGPPDAYVLPDAGPPDAAFTGPPTAVFVVPREGRDSFYDLPWPSDLRLTAEGTIDVSGFPSQRNGLLNSYLSRITARQRGYSTNGGVYFRFTAAVDVGALPMDPADSRMPGSSVFLLDVDPSSPNRLDRIPIITAYQAGTGRYWPANMLAVRPVPGMPLAPARRYAAVVTRDLLAASGGTFARDADLEALLSGASSDPDLAAARAVYQEAIDAVIAEGTPQGDILSIAVFTTQDPVGELAAIRDWMHAEYPAPSAVPDDWTADGGTTSYDELRGRYFPAPIFQEGTIPYQVTGGAIELDTNGEPTVHGEYEARFALTVPTSAMPPGGYPVVLYSHGTGGDYRSFIRDGTASLLAQVGIATMGVDQIHHGERNPTTVAEEFLFFNVQNPDAARDNNRQSALDIVQQARLVASLTVPMTLGDRGGQPIVLDPDRIYFFGHSQGGLVGPLALGIDDASRAAVISAGSALIGYALLEKTDPVNIPALVASLLGIPNTPAGLAAEGFGFQHPVITLLQGWIDASDPSNYGPLAIERPRGTFPRRHVLSTEGLMDTFSPPGAIEALAVSMRVPLCDPVARDIAAYQLLGIPTTTGTASLNAGGGTVTAGLLQYPNEGHFAVFRDPSARARIRAFFETLVQTGVPSIPPP